MCGNECKPKDGKNPHCWVQVRQCTTIDRGSDITFKQHLDNLCDERQDQWANDVAGLIGVIDLPATDTQYHVPCYNKFRCSRVPPLHIGTCGGALRSVITTMAENMTETWMTSELYSMYSLPLVLCRQVSLSRITSYFGEKLLLLHIEGCESVVGFKAIQAVTRRAGETGEEDSQRGQGDT